MKQKKIFLTGRWSKLAMFNYVIDPELLKPFIPKHTELDIWEDHCYVSLVGFLFEDTRLKGIRVPCHSTFEEVNLRFYVKHHDGTEWKRGVVFIKEIVPKPAITFVANLFFNEHYETRSMTHEWIKDENRLNIIYSWKMEKWNSMKIQLENKPFPIHKNSEEEFITEHYWGYTKIDDKSTLEYQVEHPRWNLLPVKNYELSIDFEENYGSQFASLNSLSPHSVFVADGSEVIIRSGQKIN
jgi:uncharacterized protein YqjF (DUF2071 family)